MNLYNLIKLRFCSDINCNRNCDDCLINQMITKVEPYVIDIEVKDNCL